MTDHRALLEACAEGETVPLFVFDPAFGTRPTPRRRFLVASLRALDRQLGGALVVRSGDPTSVVPAVAREVGARTVYVTRDFGPYGRRRDAMVAEALTGAGSRLRGLDSPYSVAPGSVRKDDGSPYAVFTPFRRRWEARCRQPVAAAPGDVTWATLTSDPLPVVGDDDDTPDAASAWRRFVVGGLDGYATGRDRPGVDGTSRMSALLKLGLVHPRQLIADLDPADPDHDAYLAELGWREFYADVLFRRPETAWGNLDARFDRLPVDTGPDAVARFERWTAGQTGFAFVDAGMRELARTGWMHNRARMVTASFLVKDLHLPWQWGARHFLDHLVDGDLASNNHGWQWAAGSGTDAAPYFRVFNPTAQQHRWDPDEAYARRWIPEYGTERYPAEMVDHAAERVEALARYEMVRRG